MRKGLKGGEGLEFDRLDVEFVFSISFVTIKLVNMYDSARLCRARSLPVKLDYAGVNFDYGNLKGVP